MHIVIWLVLFFTTPAAFAAFEPDWESVIKRAGGVQAYEQLRDFMIQFDINKQHEEAHRFGGALYDAAGLSGFTICDEQFSYGCFHEFIGRAIAERGPSVIAELNDACTGTPDHLKCQHGIGHGLIAWAGYNEDNLLQALEQCATLTYADPIGGCPGGVFMEYDLRTMLGEDGRVRSGTQSDPEDVCARVPKDFKNACAYWRPQWWHELFFDSARTPGTYRELGSLCSVFENRTTYRACIEGFATTFPNFMSDPRTDVALCAGVPKARGGRIFCVAHIARSMKPGPSCS